jgi:threonine dehydrogenase-like Zn-dependent dehydrogenase
VLVIGDYGDARADFPWNQILHRELSLIGSNTGAGGWAEAVRLATAGQIPLEPLVSRRFPARRFAEAVELARCSREAVKVVLIWSEGA